MKQTNRYRIILTEICIRPNFSSVFLADHEVEPILRYFCSSVRPFVRPSVTPVNCGETAETMEFFFGIWVTLDNSDYVLDGGPIPPRGRGTSPWRG